MWKFLFYMLAIITLLSMKLFFGQASLSELQFMIAPTSHLVSLFSSLSFDFQADQGYYNAAYQVVIDKSCAGTSFFTIAFGMSLLSSIRNYSTKKAQLTLFFSVLLSSFLVTLFANTSRICTALFLLKSGISLPFFSAVTWHTAQGAFIYLSILIGYHFLLQHIHSKITHRHAQFAQPKVDTSH